MKNNVEKSVLKNNLSIYTVKKDVGVATLSFGLKAGVLVENDKNNGISHLVEHMLFKGTSNRTVNTLREDFETFGGDYNAYTDVSSITGFANVLTCDIENSISLFSDILMNSTFENREFEKEKNVVLSEIKISEDDFNDILVKTALSSAFEKNPLRNTILGTYENVSKIKRDDAYDFYKRHFVPSNVVIVVVSELEHGTIVDAVEKYFGAWVDNGFETKPCSTDKNVPGCNTFLNPTIEQGGVFYLYHIDAMSPKDEIALHILNYKLGGSANSLLFSKIREENGLCYSIDSLLELKRGANLLCISASSEEKNVDNIVRMIDECIDDLLSGRISFSEKDLQLAAKVFNISIINTIDRSDALASRIVEDVLNGKGETSIYEIPDIISEIDADYVLAIAKKALKNPSITILRPEISSKSIVCA